MSINTRALLQMLLLLSRPPLPDAPYWPGRHWLAVLDALAWPLIWLSLLDVAHIPAGPVGWVATFLAVWIAVVRCHRALWLNHRYRFTTWRWGRVTVEVLALGIVIKMLQAY